MYVTIAKFFVGALLALICATASAQSSLKPFEVTLEQRSGQYLTALGDKLYLYIDDITGNQVLVSIKEQGDPMLTVTSMRAGDVKSFHYRGQEYFLLLKEYHNFLFGSSDFCVFLLSSEKPPQSLIDAVKREHHLPVKPAKVPETDSGSV
ncbi:MAG: hypothetical protein ACPG4U_05390 [Pseudomonadales bacterium]